MPVRKISELAAATALTGSEVVPVVQGGATVAATAGNLARLYGPLNNLTAGTDPGAANDGTQGYGVGSVWFNTATGVTWRCRNAAAGAAQWVSSLSHAHAIADVTGLQTALDAKQAGAATLTAIAGLAGTGLIERTGSGTAGVVTVTAAAKALLDDADAATQHTTLGLGSAATLTAGTAAGNVVPLDGTAALPFSVFPAGIILPFAGAAAPTGWLLCDGSLVSRTAYAALFAVLGTAYGAGDGSTTFKLPDLRGRTLIGAGTGAGLTARTRGEVGGEEAHTLTTAELVAHTHTYSSGTNSGGAYAVIGGGGAFFYQQVQTNSGSTGSGQPFNVMQPFAVATFIIKA